LIIEHEINCVFLDWFPSKEKLEEENDNYIREEINMIENAISSFEKALLKMGIERDFSNRQGLISLNFGNLLQLMY